MLQKLARMFANIDQEPEKRWIGKNSDQNKEPSRVIIEDSQSTSIVPEPSDYVAAIYLGKPHVGQVEKIDEESEEAHINFLEHKGNLQRRSKFNKPKKKIKHGFLFLISFVLFQSPQLRALKIYPEVLDNVLEKLRVT